MSRRSKAAERRERLRICTLIDLSQYCVVEPVLHLVKNMEICWKQTVLTSSEHVPAKSGTMVEVGRDRDRTILRKEKKRRKRRGGGSGSVWRKLRRHLKRAVASSSFPIFEPPPPPEGLHRRGAIHNPAPVGRPTEVKEKWGRCESCKKVFSASTYRPGPTRRTCGPNCMGHEAPWQLPCPPPCPAT